MEGGAFPVCFPPALAEKVFQSVFEKDEAFWKNKGVSPSLWRGGQQWALEEEEAFCFSG